MQLEIGRFWTHDFACIIPGIKTIVYTIFRWVFLYKCGIIFIVGECDFAMSNNLFLKGGACCLPGQKYMQNSA